MDILELVNQQLVLILLIVAGAILWRAKVIDEEGKRCLTDLCINIIIPCSIVKSCIIEFDMGILRTCGKVLIVATLMQVVCLVANQFLFNRYEGQQKKVLQYCTIVSNGGFLGNAIAEGMYGGMGLLYAAVFLIPVRIIMWSAGTSYFVAGGTDRKKVVKNILTHPCLVAVYLGLILMIAQIPVPTAVESALGSIGGCTAAMTMFIIGTILADVDLRTIVNKTTVLFSIWRLLLLPMVSLGFCLVLGLAGTAAGVSVVMAGMPAGATAAIFAARYHSDAPFATKCVVLTTLLSMLTIPLWAYFVG